MHAAPELPPATPQDWVPWPDNPTTYQINTQTGRIRAYPIPELNPPEGAHLVEKAVQNVVVEPPKGDESLAGDAYDTKGPDELRAIAKLNGIDVKGLREKALRIRVREGMNGAQKPAPVTPVQAAPMPPVAAVQVAPPPLPVSVGDWLPNPNDPVNWEYHIRTGEQRLRTQTDTQTGPVRQETTPAPAKPGAITSFRGTFLSNFHPCKITLDGQQYPSVEHAYQAAKTTDMAKRGWLQADNTSAAEAKSYGKMLPLRDGWEGMKVSVMEYLLRQKFRTDTFPGQELLRTGDVDLVEGNTWGDVFWGVCNGKGENRLGRLLMQIRKEIAQAAQHEHEREMAAIAGADYDEPAAQAAQREAENRLVASAAPRTKRPKFTLLIDTTPTKPDGIVMTVREAFEDVFRDAESTLNAMVGWRFHADGAATIHSYMDTALCNGQGSFPDGAVIVLRTVTAEGALLVDLLSEHASAVYG
jgi:hypothetical protein